MNTIRMNMKSYGNHNAIYDSRILAICPEHVIDNPEHGLYGTKDGYWSGLLINSMLAKYKAVGIKVWGYISSGYEGKGGDDGYATKWYSLAQNKLMIKNMAELDHVDGIFLDECSEQPNTASKSYLKELADYAHSLGLKIWGNTGVDQFNEWFFTCFDYMQSSEAWVGQALSAVQKKWGSRIGVTGFKSTYTAQKAYDLTINAWNKGLAYCYINTNEYTKIAPWFEEYAQMLRDYQQPAPPCSHNWVVSQYRCTLCGAVKSA